MPLDITSANATAVLSVDRVYPSGIVLQQFSADTALELEQIQIAETRIGVDGYLAAGYVPDIQIVNISLEASSPSFQPLTQVWNLMRTNRTIYECQLTVTVPSIDRVFSWSNGVLQSGVPFTSLSRVLDPTSWVFHFERLDYQRLGGSLGLGLSINL